MKDKLSISIEKDTIKVVEHRLKEGLFRNKSHLIEYALNQFLNLNKEQK